MLEGWVWDASRGINMLGQGRINSGEMGTEGTGPYTLQWWV